SLLQLNGTSASTPTQYLSGTGTYSLNDLTINNTHTLSQSIVLNAPLYLTNDLTLTSGIVSTTSTNILALETNATSTSGSASSYISGPMSKAGTAAFTFPVGKGGRWRRIGISAPSSSSTFRAEYFNTAYTNTSSVNAPITDVSKLEYWQLDRTVGTGNASVSLYWESANASGIDNCADLTIVRFNGTGWDERAATTTTSSSCSGTGTGIVTTTAVVTAFSPFTFGSKSTGVNPLPIELIDFDAECVGTNVKLTWASASEVNNDYYYIQRSADAKDWVDLEKVVAATNGSHFNTYEVSDELNSNEQHYYRLVQVDKDKTKTIFETVSLECGKETDKLGVYPNPASGTVHVKLNFGTSYGAGTIRITDNLGKTCYEKQIVFAKGVQVFTLPLNIVPGLYLLVVESGVLRLPVQKIIVK
ncbi:MAG: T9SS type A sorting domain-containing protein, partial [Bacteroidia bacterium]|nr:T9SS type A sorting domain-containing protein [Bacteroidia bacterium]